MKKHTQLHSFLQLLAFLQKITTLFLLFMSLQAAATHIVGGEMTYECLGNNNYRITLKVYRDCKNGKPAYDAPAVVGIFDRNNELVKTLEMTTGDSVRIPVILIDSCHNIPSDTCVTRAIYRGIVNLPFRAGGYILAYQRCCRNYSITNIVMPDGTGGTYSCYISELALQTCNSSAVFKNFPPPLICNHKAIYFDHSARDVDGDSLVYRLCAPFAGLSTANPRVDAGGSPDPPPYQAIVWQAPFSLANVMGGTPLSINSHTGLLTGKPNTIGQFVVGICVEEYRNGVLISTTRRDFQYNVGNCISLYSGVIEAPNIICSGLTVHFVNKSRGGGTHYAWNFGVSGTNRDTSTLFSPSYTFPDTGCYTIRLITEPNEPCHDTVYKRICLRTSSVYADFKLHYKNCNDTLRLQATDLSRDSVLHITSWYWNWGTGSSTQQNPTIILNNSGTYTVSLEVISANGCRHLYRKTFTVTKFNVQRDKTLYLCKGNQVNINPTGNPNFTYNWTPAATLNDATNYNPKASPVATTTYKTVFSNYSLDTCSVTQHVTVNVSNDPPNFGIMATPSTTIYKGQTVNLAIQPTENNVTYTWLPNPLLQNTSANNQTVKPPQTTTFAVRGVRRPSGCMALDTIQIILKDVICGEPLIFLPNAFTPNGDGENDVLFLRSSVVADVYFAIYNRWGEKVFDTHDLATGWDGTYKGEALPPDVFGFYLKATCFDGAEFTKKGNITLIR